jgi:hypothetical protein
MTSPLEKGRDYYVDGDRVIFTASFHIRRGQCCGNGCRHCPYTPKHTKGTITYDNRNIEGESSGPETQVLSPR